MTTFPTSMSTFQQKRNLSNVRNEGLHLFDAPTTLPKLMHAKTTVLFTGLSHTEINQFLTGKKFET